MYDPNFILDLAEQSCINCKCMHINFFKYINPNVLFVHQPLQGTDSGPEQWRAWRAGFQTRDTPATEL